MELLHFSHKQKWFTVVQRAVLLVNYEIPSIDYLEEYRRLPSLSLYWLG